LKSKTNKDFHCNHTFITLVLVSSYGRSNKHTMNFCSEAATWKTEKVQDELHYTSY